jgi:formylglycine-generating enzyme required for sulfatase activity
MTKRKLGLATIVMCIVGAYALVPVEAEGGEFKEKPRCGLGMIHILAATYTMGDDKTNDKAGEAKVASYCIDRTEVTASAYEASVKSGTCTATQGGDPSCNAGVADRKNHPINCVDWSQANAYCESLGRRLPTEEEWENAARGRDGRPFPWGKDQPKEQLCWNRSAEGKPNTTCPVASYAKGNSPFGVADMAGNVFEWTSTEDGAHRISRGGSWVLDNPDFVRSAFRVKSNPAMQDAGLGFRCASAPLH